jgi:glutathione synthase/RimK-type ligase-like ATP-grasp enzyme
LDVVLWNWLHHDAAAQVVARQIIFALEKRGLVVFPNYASCWHYDDKVGQKYLLESVGAPLIPTWVFFDEQEALQWVAHATWPKVFKLRCGAGSSNVQLVNCSRQAERLCHRAFGAGFSASAGYFHDLQSRLRRAHGPRAFLERLQRAPRAILKASRRRREMPRQRGYAYFQEFLANNPFDTRITVIGDRAFGYVRMNRANDFRASGSGDPRYEPDRIDMRCVEIAFQVADRLGTQSLAFDFLFDSDRKPRIAEISYCYVAYMVNDCRGQWDHQLRWHEGHIWPQDAILEDLLTRFQSSPPVGRAF